MLAIMLAFWCMSVKVVRPRSAIPRRDMAVPAPVWRGVSETAIGIDTCVSLAFGLEEHWPSRHADVEFRLTMYRHSKP
jgi:hypothetical protein